MDAAQKMLEELEAKFIELSDNYRFFIATDDRLEEAMSVFFGELLKFRALVINPEARR